MSRQCIYIALWLMCASLVQGPGFMLLYRPLDVTAPCAHSRYLRYDVSYGMGMSDTITLVFRTMFEVDYACTVEIAVEADDAYLLVVVRYPNTMELNCQMNEEAITVLKRRRCLRLCDFVKDQHSTHIVFPVVGRLRFRFISNSSINAEMNAYVYQVTATSARAQPTAGCYQRNETGCSVRGQHYCFTSGVICDGVRNCGVGDWFDERISSCGLPVQKLGYAPVVAVAAALLCALVAAAHVLLRCLPPQATSFFIFNANEDNRLCIDPTLCPRGSQTETPETRQHSLVYDSSSSDNDTICHNPLEPLHLMPKPLRTTADPTSVKASETPAPRRRMTMRLMTSMVQDALRRMTGSRSVSAPAVPLDTFETTTDI